jgi:uncharacterized protein YaiI (UPF0178 family)
MQIWVDADACPRAAKEIHYRAAERVRVLLTLVANKPLRVPRSPYIQAIQVAGGFDVADDAIAARVQEGDLVITADIPLAAAVVRKGACALDPRGTLYTRDNVGEMLAMRNLMDELRSSGQVTGGPPKFDYSDRMAFAGRLDRYLASVPR